MYFQYTTTFSKCARHYRESRNEDTGVPLYLAFLFGGIALATAPAPALSIVREFKTKGPITSTLIPMAALDDIVGCVVFFSTIAIVAGNLSAGELPPI